MKNREAGSSRPWTILNLLGWATEYLDNPRIENPKVTAEILLAHCLRLRRIVLYLQYDRPLDRRELAGFKTLLKRKLAREPVAYIVGCREVWSIPLSVSRDVLIPRPETECLAEAVLEVFEGLTGRGALRVLELGTGSGALIIALAREKKGNAYCATDISPRALAVAKQNAERNGSSGVHFLAADWMAPLAEGADPFDVIVSNPPYVRRREIEDLSPEIRRYEPVLALDGGEDGLDCLRRIVPHAWSRLKPHGWLLLEIGWDQKKAVVNLAESCGKYDQIQVLKDYSGHDRIVKMRSEGPGESPETGMR